MKVRHVDVDSRKFCMRGRVWVWVPEVVIYFKFHENRLRVLTAVGSKNRSLSFCLIAKLHGLYNRLYYGTSRDIFCGLLQRCDLWT